MNDETLRFWRNMLHATMILTGLSLGSLGMASTGLLGIPETRASLVALLALLSVLIAWALAICAVMYRRERRRLEHLDRLR